MQISFKSWHLVVWEQEDIEKLISFCGRKEVRYFAYIRHIPKNPEGRVHYHFWIFIKSAWNESAFENILKISRSQIMKHYGDKISLLRYFIRGNDSEYPPSKDDLVTNYPINLNSI